MELLPPPDAPTSATTSPGAATNERPHSTGASGRDGYANVTSTSSMRPCVHSAGGGEGEGRSWRVWEGNQWCGCKRSRRIAVAPDGKGAGRGSDEIGCGCVCAWEGIDARGRTGADV
eukprot:110887-Chlamydomonas_euryale.AAC.2